MVAWVRNVTWAAMSGSTSLMSVVGWDSVVNLINEQQNTWWLAFLPAWGSEHNHVSQYTITVYKTILYCLHLLQRQEDACSRAESMRACATTWTWLEHSSDFWTYWRSWSTIPEWAEFRIRLQDFSCGSCEYQSLHRAYLRSDYNIASFTAPHTNAWNVRAGPALTQIG